MKLLIATAVAAERDAVRAGVTAPDIDVVAVGVGPAAAAAGTARLLARQRYDAVISAGIAGGIPGRAGIGDVVIATRSVAADLGAESPDGFLPMSQLGFGDEVITPDLTLRHPAAVTGAVLTLSTVTGTQQTAEVLAQRYPDAVAEAMEGFGVATAARGAGVRFGELRAVSNLIGPRDKSAWRVAHALDALTAAIATVTKELT